MVGGMGGSGVGGGNARRSGINKSATERTGEVRPNNTNSGQCVFTLPDQDTTEDMFLNCRSLCQSRQYKSCELASSYLLSILKQQQRNNAQQQNRQLEDVQKKCKLSFLLVETMEILGDCAVAQLRHHQAVALYRQAAVLARNKPLHLLKFPNSTSVPNRNVVDQGNEEISFLSLYKGLSLHYKTSQSLIVMRGQDTEALSELKTALLMLKDDDSNVTDVENEDDIGTPIIKHPPAQQLLIASVHLEYAKLCHRKCGRKPLAKIHYRKCIQYYPLFCVEIISEVIDLGITEGAIMKDLECSCIGINEDDKDTRPAVTTTELYQSKEKNEHQLGSGLDEKFMNSTALSGSNKFMLPILRDIVDAFYTESSTASVSAALSKFINIGKKFPDNIAILDKIAQLQLRAGDYISSERTFSIIRRRDPHRVDGMDTYGELLHRRNACALLHAMATELLEIYPDHPVPWSIMALYHMSLEVKGGEDENGGTAESAAECIDRAIRLDVNHTHALPHRLRGALCLNIFSRPDEAVSSFYRANEIQCDYASYEGLVESYLAEEKYKEAMFAAKEYITEHPRDARALTLVGLALSHSPSASREGREKAKLALRKALSLDPHALRSLFVLGELLCSEGDFDGCVQLLIDAIERSGRTEDHDLLHCKLADVYTVGENYSDALTHYHAAISMNPENAEAQRGLDRLEKLMRGVDPNASAADPEDEDEEYGEDMEDATNFEVDAGARGYL